MRSLQNTHTHLTKEFYNIPIFTYSHLHTHINMMWGRGRAFKVAKKYDKLFHSLKAVSKLRLIYKI